MGEPSIDHHRRKNRRERRDMGTGIRLDGTAHLETANNTVSDPLAVNSRVGSMSLWFNPLVGAAQKFLLDFNSPSVLEMALEASNRVTLFGFGSGGLSFAVGSSSAYLLDGKWKHVLLSWDNQLATPTAHMYLNDAENLGAFTANDRDTQYSLGDQMRIGSTGTDASRFNGWVAELWIDATTQLDFSVVANRRKFITADGQRVDLGRGGKRPLGAKPFVFHTNRYGGGVNGFAKGRGAMPDLTVMTGPGVVTSHIGQVVRAKGSL